VVDGHERCSHFSSSHWTVRSIQPRLGRPDERLIVQARGHERHRVIIGEVPTDLDETACLGEPKTIHIGLKDDRLDSLRAL